MKHKFDYRWNLADANRQRKICRPNCSTLTFWTGRRLVLHSAWREAGKMLGAR